MTGTWTGSASSVAFSNSAKTRVKTIKITYGEVTACSTPTFTPADGTTFVDGESLSVTLSCSNPTDATFYYTTDGTTPTTGSTKYENAISISSTTTIKAIAVDGTGTLTQSEVATATYTKLEVLTFAGLREAIDTDASSTAKAYAVNLDGAVVTYVYNSYTASIEKDGVGILFYGKNTFTAGDVLTGTATVTALTYNGVPEITTMTGQTVTSGGTAPEPTTVTISQILSDEDDAYLCRYVTVKNAIVGTAVTSSNRNGTITDKSSETALILRSYAKTLTADAGTPVNVTGIAQKYNDDKQIIFYEQSQIEELGSTFTISLSEGYATYYNAKAYIMPEGVVGYIITGTTLNSVTADERGALSIEEKYKAGSTVPARTALLLYGNPDTYTFYYTTSEETAPTGNLLHGADAVDGNGYTYVEGDNVKYYLLSLNQAEEAGSLGFYWYAADGAAIAYVSPYAFLAVDFGSDSTTPVKMFTFGEESTGIRSLASDTDGAKDAAIYTLAGQRVSSMSKGGIYIVNGKKVLVR